MVLARRGKSYLGPAEITFYASLISFKDGFSPRFHLFVLDVNQGDEEVGSIQDLRDPKDGKIFLRSSGNCSK